ncbi:MACPF domain-containing protein At1g14780-like isoform X2 [Populus nigra]|nr:MACPF domain-containing protein At1g14780-like isoform X2 [Populus nigra]
MMSNGIMERAQKSLGRGFDLTSDFRLKFCKGEKRLVFLNEAEKKELKVPGFGVIKDVSVDIKCDKGDRIRYQSDILEFHQMSELFNQKASVPGKIPSGLFNSMFGFEGCTWAADAANTKCLGLDGFFISLFSFRIDRYPLVLCDEVRKAVPSSWDPCALARFIEKYGTHIIVGLSIGGQDVVLVSQDKSSNLGSSELQRHLDDLGDQLFTGTCNFTPKARDQKSKTPQAFNVFDPQPVAFDSFSSIRSAKDGITVLCAKKGGDTSVSSHCEWLPTVPSMPDAIHFSFIPITSLLKEVPGKGFLSHAINLYLRYKPPISDLHYFLDFHSLKIWAPVHNDFPLGPSTNLASSSSALHFYLLGPKLYVNTSQVTVGKRPVTGMRFYLEGMKCNRLAIHLQHLANTPSILANKIDDSIQLWRGTDETDNEGYFEAIHRKKFSHICTAPVKYDPRWSAREDVAYIVTGAKLQIKNHNSKRVLHLRLLFSKVSYSFIVQSSWAQGSSGFSQRSGLFSAISTSVTGNPGKEKPKPVVVDSSVFPSGPPVPVQTQKLLKFVDISHLCRGPQDSPGHWLVTGARLDLDKGKISLQVKFSLLNIYP